MHSYIPGQLSCFANQVFIGCSKCRLLIYSHRLGQQEDEAGWLIHGVFRLEVELHAAGGLLPVQGSRTSHESPIYCLVVRNSPLVVHRKPPPLIIFTCPVPITRMPAEPQ